MKNSFVKVINIVLIIVSIFMGFTSLLFLYYKTLGKDKVPNAITSTYATTVTDPNTGEELSTIEANYYPNKNGKGYEVVELLFNCYSGVSQQAIYSRGFQLVDDGKNEPQLYYYDSYDGVSFETGHQYTWGTPLLVDIDGDIYALVLDGTYTTTKTYTDGWKIVRSIGFVGLNFFFEDTNMTKTETTIHKYTVVDLMEKIASIIKSSSNGTGDSVIPLIDLGDFLHIYDVNDNGQISTEPIGKNTLTNSYFTMDTHYDNRGMVLAKQSLFNSVAYDSQFNISGLLDNVEYWKVNSQITITQEDFVPRKTTDGNYYYLSLDKVKELKSYKNVDIFVNFNVSSIQEPVLGFDVYAFSGLKLKSLTITSVTQQDFILLTDCLKDSGISSINTTNITIDDKGAGL